MKVNYKSIQQKRQRVQNKTIVNEPSIGYDKNIRRTRTRNKLWSSKAVNLNSRNSGKSFLELN